VSTHVLRYWLPGKPPCCCWHWPVACRLSCDLKLVVHAYGLLPGRHAWGGAWVVLGL